MNSSEPVQFVWLPSYLARFTRRLLGNPGLRQHSGIDVDSYGSEECVLSAFPLQKGIPFNADNLTTVCNHSLMADPQFSWARSIAEGRWSHGGVRDMSWRLHGAMWTIANALRTTPSENFLELDTGKGSLAARVCVALAPEFANQLVALMGSLDGKVLSELVASNSMSEVVQPFCFPRDVDEVRQYFSQFRSIEVARATCPVDVESLPAGSLALIHVDLNDFVVEVATLRALKSCVQKNAIILFDDSGNPGYSEAVIRLSDLVESWGSSILAFTTGQTNSHHSMTTSSCP